MPDHIHVFVKGSFDLELGAWVRGLKRVVAAAVAGGRSSQLWQRGFFDHLIRNSESYSQKWHYILENPVRAGFVSKWEDWPYQGELVQMRHS
jgi:REP element-mobilizing transposase RayT